jgi:exodeoxyribonuclease-3
MKLISWNVNGIRAAERSGFCDWFEKEQSDMVCVQETKAQPEQLTEALLHPGKYYSYWHSAQKAGYSGVAIFSKKEALRVQAGMGIPEIDHEGRVLLAEFAKCIVINAYFPNSQRDHARLDYKLRFCSEFLKFCELVRKQSQTLGKPLIICGDFNIAHQPIDLKNPISNANNAGFLPQERAWMDTFIEHGYIDAFRAFNQAPNQYTWWSYRPGVREKNIGWRLDYCTTPREFKDRLKNMIHHTHVRGSDHCPIELNSA